MTDILFGAAGGEPNLAVFERVAVFVFLGLEDDCLTFAAAFFFICLNFRKCRPASARASLWKSTGLKETQAGEAGIYTQKE